VTEHSITAIVGNNGDGKTLAAVALHAVPSLNRGRPVVANFTLYHPLATKLDTWRDIPTLEHCTLILDEISSAFPSRESMHLPPELVRMIHQLRKPDVDVVWTAVNWSRADVVLREATQNVTVCRGRANDKWQRDDEIPPAWRPNAPRKTDLNDKPLRRTESWKANRYFKYMTYDARAFDEFTIHAIKNLKPHNTERYWRPWHDAHRLYDTMEQVPLLDNLDVAGPCPICGGTRRRPSCPGHPELAPRANARGPASTGVPVDTHTEANHA
jgi:hypothetical protein